MLVAAELIPSERTWDSVAGAGMVGQVGRIGWYGGMVVWLVLVLLTGRGARRGSPTRVSLLGCKQVKVTNNKYPRKSPKTIRLSLTVCNE